MYPSFHTLLDNSDGYRYILTPMEFKDISENTVIVGIDFANHGIIRVFVPQRSELSDNDASSFKFITNEQISLLGLEYIVHDFPKRRLALVRTLNVVDFDQFKWFMKEFAD